MLGGGVRRRLCRVAIALVARLLPLGLIIREEEIIAALAADPRRSLAVSGVRLARQAA
jgi:hypothetical protein